MQDVKKILLVPLDWGLGHATRCIPIIRLLLQEGHEVFIGGNAQTNALLKKEFPNNHFLSFDGYNISYARTKIGFFLSLLRQIPRMISAVKNEKKQLDLYLQQYQFDLIISDNRYGLFHPTIPSVIITHQLNIQIPFSRLIQRIVRWQNHRWLKQFHEVWVPDDPAVQLSGTLSEQGKALSLHYIGLLSRMHYISSPPKYDLLFLLSGPEPQRSMMEKKLTQLIPTLGCKCALVRGKPLENEPLSIEGADVFAHLPSNELNHLIASASKIICRSGYSTLMDLLFLRKHALLVPTPGQSEQEYLARHLALKGWFHFATQESLDADRIKHFLASHPSKPLPVVDIENAEMHLKQRLNYLLYGHT